MDENGTAREDQEDELRRALQRAVDAFEVIKLGYTVLSAESLRAWIANVHVPAIGQAQKALGRGSIT